MKTSVSKIDISALINILALIICIGFAAPTVLDGSDIKSLVYLIVPSLICVNSVVVLIKKDLAKSFILANTVLSLLGFVALFMFSFLMYDDSPGCNIIIFGITPTLQFIGNLIGLIGVFSDEKSN